MLPIDVNHSVWDNTLEDGARGLALRLGLRQIDGFRQDWADKLAAARGDSPEAAAALDQLCRTYWYPLYANVRRRGYSPEDAQDLIQEFFARLLAISRLRQRFREMLREEIAHTVAAPSEVDEEIRHLRVVLE